MTTATEYSRDHKDAAVLRVLRKVIGSGPMKAAAIASHIHEDWCYVKLKAGSPGFPICGAITPCLKRIGAIRLGRAGYIAPLEKRGA